MPNQYHYIDFIKKKYNLNKKNFKNSIIYGGESLSLPVHHQINKKQITRICKLVLKFFNGK